MHTQLTTWKKSGLGLLAAAALTAFTACAIQEGDTNDPSGTGQVVSVKDSSQVSLDFNDLAKTVFRDSGEFNLDTVRANLANKSISLSSVNITGLEVTYNDSTKAFLEANKGVRYTLKIFIRESDTSAAKLALETSGIEPGTTPLSFDTAQVLFELTKQLFAQSEGFPGLITDIQDTNKHKLWVICEMTLVDPMKATGPLRLNMVVSVAGKV